MVRVGLILSVIALLFVACESSSPEPAVVVEESAPAPEQARGGMLANWQLAQRLDSGNVVIVDVRPDSLYAQGHIPGAVQIWRPDIQSADYPYGGMALTREETAALLDSLGATGESTVVAYDGKHGCDAARFWWMLRWYGHPDVHLLEGNAAQFASETHLALETGAGNSPSPRGYTFPQNPENTWHVSLEEMVELYQDSTVLVIDTRSHDEYTGERQKNGAARPGHIPGAVRWDWVRAQDVNPSCIKSNEALTKDLARFDLDKYDRIVTYCHTGVRSAHTAFVLRELLGYQNVSNYDGSWTEWSHMSELPAAGEALKNE